MEVNKCDLSREKTETPNDRRMELSLYRRDGNTTRLVDFYIQLLFRGYTVKCLDHHKLGEHRESNERLLNLILRRLALEHSQISINVDFVHTIIALNTDK